LALSVIVQVPVPLQGPDQPAKFELPLGFAVSVKTVPCTKLALQFEPQLIPAGLLITVPSPDPDLFTVSVAVGARLNVATTAFSPGAITVVQVPVPVHPPPLQPANIDPDDGVAVSVTILPVGNEALQLFPQLIPAGVLVTVPVPVPILLTVRVEGTALNVAVTNRF
jgi:hypothetical protein